jgi:hypothetical protein
MQHQLLINLLDQMNLKLVAARINGNYLIVLIGRIAIAAQIKLQIFYVLHPIPLITNTTTQLVSAALEVAAGQIV